MAKKKVFSIGRSLSDGLEQTIAAAHNYSSDLRVDVIPLAKIIIDPENPRAMTLTLDDLLHEISPMDPHFTKKNEEICSLQSLANSILDQGIINPIMVYELNGFYKLIAGERRTLASALAKKKDIQAKILDGKPTELKIRVLQWIENIERSDLRLAEKMDNLDKIVSSFCKEQNIAPSDIRITDISQLVGCVKSHAIVLKSVLNADDDLKQMINANQIRSIEKAAIISNIKSDSLRKEAMNKCANGATLKQLKAMLEQDKLIISNQSSNLKKQNEIVSFGTTINLTVAKIILESVIFNNNMKEYLPGYDGLDFKSPQIIASTFKKLVSKLEQIHEHD